MTIATNTVTHRIINCAECGTGFRAVHSARKYCVNCARVVRRRQKRETMREARQSPMRVQNGLIRPDWLGHDNKLSAAERDALEGTPCATCRHLRACQDAVRQHRRVRCER